MSVFSNAFQPASVPLREVVRDLRPQLALVRGEAGASNRYAYAILLAVIAIAGLGSYLAVQTQLGQGMFEERLLSSQLRTTTAQVQELEQQVTVMSASTNLDERARELGMVRMGATAFLRLSDGKVIGEPLAAKANDEQAAHVATLNNAAVMLTPDGSALLHPSQLRTDDGAVLLSEGEN